MTELESKASVPEVRLLTRAGCHLCEEAWRVVDDVAARVGIPWSEWDAEAYPELALRHAEEIPVVFVNGIQRDFWTIDEGRLERILRQEMSKQA